MIPYIITNKDCSELICNSREMFYRDVTVRYIDQYIYEILPIKSVELMCYERLYGSDLIPHIYGIEECSYKGNRVAVVKMDRYEGCLCDHRKIDPPTICEIANKIISLNTTYKIWYGDLTSYSLAYIGDKWLFADFCTAIIYDNDNRVIGNQNLYNADKNECDILYESHYDPYHDLLSFETYFEIDNIHIHGIPSESVKRFRHKWGDIDCEYVCKLMSDKKQWVQIDLYVKVINDKLVCELQK